jgi:HK97 family phage major capsid protein
MPGENDNIESVKKELVRVTDEVKNIGEDIRKKYEKGAVVSEELKQKADEALSGMNGLTARLTDIEQKLARAGDEDAKPQRKSLGQMVVEDEAVASFMERRPGKSSVGFAVKAITSLTTDADGSAGAAIEADRVEGIQRLPVRRMTVRDLLTPGTTGSNAIQYVQETGFTNSAAPVAEGAQKPESTLKLALRTVPVQVIAHFIHASKQILDDAAQLRSLIDFRLRYGLAYAEELQLLNGDGTGVNLDGLIANATAYAAPFTPAGTLTVIDKLRLAMVQAVLAEYPATGHVLNPIDAARIVLEKDTTGRYIIGDPQQGNTTLRLWGLPVVETQAMAQDKFLTGAFRLGAQVFDREEANIEVSTEDRDNFIKNMVTVRGEERLALAVYRPEAFVYGDLGYVA